MSHNDFNSSNVQDLQKSDEELINRIVKKIEAVCITRRTAGINLSSVIFLIERELYQLRLVDSIPARDIINEFFDSYFAVSSH
ncbi:MAG: hypothetical protein ABR969_06810 [Sedimentisphaerales bacterium]|jgi:hypothetical protein